MSLHPISSKLKNLTMVFLFMISAAFLNAQDSITAFNQTGTARLDVSTAYLFTLTSTNVNAVNATWSVTGGAVTPTLTLGVDYTMIATTGKNVQFTFDASLISPANANANVNRTYVVTASWTGGSVSITITLLPQFGLLAENLQVDIEKLDKTTLTFVPAAEIEITKGERDDEGETIRVVTTFLPKTPALPFTLNSIKKVKVKILALDNNDLFPISGEELPPLIQLKAFSLSNGALLNSTIPALNVTNAVNELGFKEFVFFRYEELPYLYRMDRLNYNNNGVAPADRENWSNFKDALPDPRINYDILRNKLWFPDTINEIEIYNTSATAPASAGNMQTDLSALRDIGTAGSPNWRPNANPSATSIAGANSGVFANRFLSNFDKVELPLKALEYGAEGSVKMVIEFFGSEGATLPAFTKSIIVRVLRKVPDMRFEFAFDAEDIGTFSAAGSVTTVAGKDVNLRVRVKRVLASGQQIYSALEGPSGAQEYVKIESGIGSMWAFKNFDEKVFDAMEFDPTNLATNLQTSNAVLYGGVAGWHNGLKINLQSYGGALSNCLFNDLPYLLANDRNSYSAANYSNLIAMINNGRYTILQDVTEFGLIKEVRTPELDPAADFMYSQARLYTKDAIVMREGLSSASEVNFALNLFRNYRTQNNVAFPQRALTFVPQAVGTYDIKINLYDPVGAIITTATVQIDVIPEIVNVTAMDRAEASDDVAKPVRAGDLITYQDKSISSTYADIGITSFNMRLEGIGSEFNILHDLTSGFNGAQSYGEVDMDDVAYFAFTATGIGGLEDTFFYRSANDGGGQGILGRSDLDGDSISNENLYESTGIPEPIHLQFNGIDDDNDGVVDDRVEMPTGRVESSSIRINTASRSIEYRGGTLRRYYDSVAGASYTNFEVVRLNINNFRTAVSGLNSFPAVLTVASINAVEAAYSSITDTSIAAAFAAFRADPFLTTMLPGAPRRSFYTNNITSAISAYEYNYFQFGNMVDVLVLLPGSARNPRDNFAPLPTITGMNPSTIPQNTYRGEIVNLNQFTVSSSTYDKPLMRARFVTTCVPPAKESWIQFAHSIPWINRTGGIDLLPLAFGRKGETLTTGFKFTPSNSVTDKKFTGPFADLSKYPSFTDAQMTLLGEPDTYQNFSTTFRFTGGADVAVGNFVNRLNNNYRPFLNEPPPPLPGHFQYENLAGLKGWIYTYTGDTLVIINDSANKEGTIWVVEQRYGPILDIPDAHYNVTDPATFTFSRQNQIIVPEEDNRWRPDDTELQGFESWYRVFPTREVLSMESNYIAQFGIDEGVDVEHTATNSDVIPSPYSISYLNPSPAFHEIAGNNSALRLFLPGEMLDNNATNVAAPFMFFEDFDDNGLFNLAVDRARNTGSIHSFNALTRTFSALISVNGRWDDKYDEHYDYFIVTRFDSGYPDIQNGRPPFNVTNQPDSSAVRFGLKVEMFKPAAFPKASPNYLTFIDHDGKEERSTQDNYIVVNAIVDENDVNMKIDIYADTDHPLESAGLVVHQGGTRVLAMTGLDVKGSVSSGSYVDLRVPDKLLANNFGEASQKFGTSSFPFAPFSRTALSTLILTGDTTSQGIFPLTSQGTTTLPGGILWNHIKLPVLPIAERGTNFDRIIERKNTWRNDVYAQVRPFERDKNGNGICDPGEDFNSDGKFTQDVVMLKFIPEKYPAGHPLETKSFYNETNDFLNMADIRWSIVKNESGSYLSSDTGYLIPGDSTGTNHVTYYPGSLNGLDYVKGENIKTGRSLVAAILVRNNPATDGIDNDNDVVLPGTYVTTIGALSNGDLVSSDPRYSIRCLNPSALTSVNLSTLENFPNIDFADDDRLDGAGSLDAGYVAGTFTNIGTGTTTTINQGNLYITPSGTYNGSSDISIVITSTVNGTLGVNPFSISVAYTDSVTTLTTTTAFTLLATTSSFVVYNNTSTSSTVTVTFNPTFGRFFVGDKYRFTMLGLKDWDRDSYTRNDELGNVPGAMYPESGYDTGLEVDISWNNPRPFYAIKVRANKTTAYDGEFGQNYVFTTNLKTKEIVGSGVWTSTVESQLGDLRYIGSGGYLSAAPISLVMPSVPSPFHSTIEHLYYRAGSVVNNTGSSSYTAGNLLVISEEQFYTPNYIYTPTTTRVARGGVDLIRITQNSNAIIRGEWTDNVGDVDNYTSPEMCLLGIHFTQDPRGRIVYDFDLATMPGDHTRYAAAVFESNHTIADYTSAGHGLLRIDPNSMPTPVLQLNTADTSDAITLTFTDGERLQKIRVNFLNVRAFKPTSITDDPNTKQQDTMLAPLSNDMLGGISVWKDNKDPGALALLNGKDLITGTNGRSATIGSLGHFDALVDVVVDMDGWDSPRAYTNYTSQYSNPAVPATGNIPLLSFTLEDKIYFVDRDGSKSFSLGDDIYFDQGQPGLDNGDRIIYTQRGLGSGSSYSLGDPAHAERLRYFDANGNGKYDNGEDIVYEANNLNARWELPIDKYVPLDKDALRWRWDTENNLWYVVLDLENGEEIPPEDVFVNLLDYIDPTIAPLNLTGLNFPGNVPPNFYNGADYHICIRTSANMDYLSAFMVEIPDFWKHTQALSNFDDIAGVWLASQPATVTYPSMPGSSIISPVIVANMPVVISDETIDRASRNRIGRNSTPFPVLGINLMDNTFNGIKLGNDLLKTIFGSNQESIPGSTYGVRPTTVNGNRKTVLEDLVIELFNNLEGTVGSVIDANGTIIPGDFNPVVDLLALDRTCKGDDIFRSVDGSGVFNSGDTKILRLGSFLINGRLDQDDLTIGKQGKQDTSIVFIDTNANDVYDDNRDILVYDIDGLTVNGLPTGVRTFKFGDAILKRGFSNWDITVGATNDVNKLTPNDLSTIIGSQLKYDSSLWYEDDDESGGFSNEVSSSGVALYRDRSDSSPYDNGKFDVSISNNNENIVLDEVIYLEEVEFAGQTGQPQHQVRMRPAVFDISTTFLSKVVTNGLADLSGTSSSFNHFNTDYGRTSKASHGGTGEDYRNESQDDLFNPFIDLNNDGKDDSNRNYPYNKDTSLPDHHPLRVNLFQDKISPSYGDENGMGHYGEWGYLRAPMDDGQASLSFDQNRAIVRNTANKHYGPDFFVVLSTSNVATNGDDFRAGISSWGRDPAHLLNSGGQSEIGNRGFGFDDRIEDFEAIGLSGGTNSAAAFLYPGLPDGYTGSTLGDVSNSRTYTKFLSAVILVDGLPPEDVKTLSASIFEGGVSGPNLVELVNQIRLDWEWEKDPDLDRTGVLLIRRKGLAPDLKLLEDGQYYTGPEITAEVGEERRKYLPSYLGFATKTKLSSDVSLGSPLPTVLTSTDVSITHADFASLPIPPTSGKCYLLIGSNSSGDKAEIVSYTTVGSTLVVKRGELGTTAVSHTAGSSVTYLPPRPVDISDFIKDTSPITGSPVAIKVDKSAGGLEGYPKEGVIRIGTEVMQYNNITIGSTSDSMDVIARGLNSTVIKPHSASNKIYWNNHPTYTNDTIFVQSTAGFPTSGRLRIDNEEMWYNSKTANSFKGVVRGLYTDDANKTNTYVEAHSSGKDVYDSLYKVIMNDKDLDGPKDFNNDKNEDSIVQTWTDDLYYGEEPSDYFYYLFTYDDVFNYSDGKFASVNSMQLKRYTAPSGTGTTATTGITFSSINLGVKINVKGGDTLFFSVEGGSPKFAWVSTAAGLLLETPPTGYDTKGENDRYISYTVPDIIDVDQTDIIITVTDSSANPQSLSVVLFVESVTPPPPDDTKLRVKSDIGRPAPVDTNTDKSVTVVLNEIITFVATVPSGGNISTLVWSSAGPNTFGGQVNFNPAQPDRLVYTATNAVNPAITSGSDVITVTDGITTINITIIVVASIDPDEDKPCDTTKPLTVVPGNSGSVIISPGSTATFTAQGGTCSFSWSLIADNSQGANVARTDNIHAVYTAGSTNRTVDVIELSDGVNTKRIEVHVVSSSSGGGGGGCFIRPTASQRD